MPELTFNADEIAYIGILVGVILYIVRFHFYVKQQLETLNDVLVTTGKGLETTKSALVDVQTQLHVHSKLLEKASNTLSETSDALHQIVTRNELEHRGLMDKLSHIETEIRGIRRDKE